MKVTNSFVELLSVCEDVKKFLELSSYELRTYDDGAEVDFKVSRVISDIQRLASLCDGHKASIFESNGYVIVRLYEKTEE